MADEPKKENEVQATSETVNPTAMLMGYMVGQAIRRMRGKREPMAFFYGSVELPKLPEWDKEKYPYAYIRYYTPEGKATAYYLQVSKYRPFSPDKAYGNAEGAPFIVMPSGGAKSYKVTPTEDETWELRKETDDSIVTSEYNESVWSNVDIFDDNGNVFIAAGYTNDPSIPTPPAPFVYPDRTAKAWSFNGIELPVPPEFDTNVYPYAVLYRSVYATNLNYYLAFSRDPYHVGYYANTLTYHTNAGQWEFDENNYTQGFGVGNLQWANYDYTDGDKHIDGTDIIPIYE